MKIMQLILFVSLLMSLLHMTHQTEISLDYPIIAILAANEPDMSETYDVGKVNLRYVRWIEASGGLAVVIQSWYTYEEIDEILSKVNGALFQGGARYINLDKRYEKTVAYIFNKVIEMNKAGIHFPLWTTCLGFEQIHAIVANTTNVLDEYNAWNIPSSIYTIKGVTNTSKMYAEFSNEDLDNLEKYNSTAEFHHKGISPETYAKYPVLNDFFKITTYGKDLEDKVYIASIEARNYPIFGVQFHPEKTPYDRNIKDNIPRNFIATKTSQKLGNLFINEALRNNHKISQEDLIKFNFIDTFVKGNQVIKNNAYIFTKNKENLKFLEK